MEVLLDALPVDGRVVLRVNDRGEEDAPPAGKNVKQKLATSGRDTGKRWSR
jgi:hypothetical protein